MGVRRVLVATVMLGLLVGTSAVIVLAARGAGVPMASGGSPEVMVPARPSAGGVLSDSPSGEAGASAGESGGESAGASATGSGFDATTTEPVVEDTGDDALPTHRPSDSGHVSVTSRVTTDDPVFFITIDDGMEQDPDALRLVRDRRVPITAFLTQWTVAGHEDYFRAMTRYGSIQNHSMTHRSFAKPETNLQWEICQTQKSYNKTFGYRPWLLRPPYGEGVERREVLQTAASCGIESIVLWDVVVSDGGQHIEWWSEGLRPGDIVLLHFTSDLVASLDRILTMADEAGLTAASLADYL